MKIRKRHGGLILTMLFALGACVEPYDPPLVDRDIRYLVVDGFLNAHENVATVRLTRTIPVKSTDPFPAESNAQVAVADEHGAYYDLIETEPGIYRGNIDINPAKNYRLMITTADRREYVSDFVEVMQTPPIDSISYSVSSSGVQFNVNTHDPTGRARHFRWEFVETWEYHSNFNSSYMFTPNGIESRPDSLAINVCYRTIASTGIMIGSTKHLSESVVSRYPMSFVPAGSIKLTVRYSLLVQQQALTEEAFDYWLNLENSTENLGGLFDPLPSEVSGNIRCISHPHEKAIGFFGAGDVVEARKFVQQYELPREVLQSFRNAYCVLDTITLAELPNVGAPLLVDEVIVPGIGLAGYTTSMYSCIDCTAQGGTTEKPTFWD